MNINDYLYDLPEERIAKYPLEDRADSKLLVYQKGVISHSQFRNVLEIAEPKSTFVFNNTKVLPARLRFTKDTGAEIEIFLMDPLLPSTDYQVTINGKSPVVWKCMIGNAKRWKEGQTLQANWSGTLVECSWYDREKQLVEFKWNNDLTFSEVILQGGEMPLPPYMKRKAESEDSERYQTVYARHQGAVAAPTAGLHFNKHLIQSLKSEARYIPVTLHVSAGTFKPVKEENVLDHDMHREFIQIEKSSLEQLINSESITAVGTTSLRTLESLYWYGVKILQGDPGFHIPKLYPYEAPQTINKKEALEAVLDHMVELSLESISGETEIFIVPGYEFRLVNQLITNFHLPGSTLILLIAAFIGVDWKKIYAEALQNNYRFLSYGDSSILSR